jgi:hypothetical protein
MKVLIKYLFETEAEYLQFFSKMNQGIELPAPKPEIVEPVIRKIPEISHPDILPEVAPPPLQQEAVPEPCTKEEVYLDCIVCGQRFLQTRKGKTTCSKECYMKDYWKHYKPGPNTAAGRKKTLREKLMDIQLKDPQPCREPSIMRQIG